MWHSGLEVSSYSWSKQQLGQGAEIVTGAERLPGERSDLGIPSEDPGPVFFLSTPSFFFFFFPVLDCSCQRRWAGCPLMARLQVGA